MGGCYRRHPAGQRAAGILDQPGRGGRRVQFTELDELAALAEAAIRQGQAVVFISNNTEEPTGK